MSSDIQLSRTHPECGLTQSIEALLHINSIAECWNNTGPTIS